MDDPTSTTFEKTTQAPSHEEISRRAQELWERYGRPSGRDEDIWLEAERELRTTVTTPVRSASPAPSSLDDGNVAPTNKPTATTVASAPTSISSSPKAPRVGAKKKPGGAR